MDEPTALTRACDARDPHLRRFLEAGESRGNWRGTSIVRFQRREQIFAVGEQSDAVYLLLRGRARVYGISASGRTITFWLPRPGWFLGVAEVLGNTSRRAYAEAREEATALRLPRGRFHELVHADREVAQAVLAQLGRRLRMSCDTTLTIATATVKVRLCRMLLLLFDDADGGAMAGTGDERHSQQELAEMIGASRQSVNEVLMELRGAGAIGVCNGMISLRDRAALLAAAEAASS